MIKQGARAFCRKQLARAFIWIQGQGLFLFIQDFVFHIFGKLKTGFSVYVFEGIIQVKTC